MERMEGLRSYKTGNGRRVTIIIMEFNFLHQKGGHFDVLQWPWILKEKNQ